MRLVKSSDARIRAAPVLTYDRAFIRDLLPIANWRLQLEPDANAHAPNSLHTASTRANSGRTNPAPLRVASKSFTLAR